MKKIVLALAAVAIVGNFAYAEYKATVNDLSDKGIERIVSFVLEKNKAGYSEEEIVTKILDSSEEFGIKKTAATPEPYVKKNAYSGEYSSNFGQYKKTLRRGEYGEDVKEAQERLNELAGKLGLSLDPLKADGKYGPATAQAVKLFQVYQGLEDDGVIGPKTLEKLSKYFDDSKHEKENESVEKYEDKEKYEKSEEESGVDSIKLEAVLKDYGVKLEWDVDGASSKGFKIVKSKEKNPVYPGDDYKYFSDKNKKEYIWNVSESYNYRVCEYLGNGKCGVYSNNVYVDISR